MNIIIDASYLEFGTSILLETNDSQVEDITITIVVNVVLVSESDNGNISGNLLQQNYPNPFYRDTEKRCGTVMGYEIGEEVKTAEINIYNIRGQKVTTIGLDLKAEKEDVLVGMGKIHKIIFWGAEFTAIY